MYNLKKGYNNTLNYIIYTYLKLVEVFQLKKWFFSKQNYYEYIFYNTKTFSNKTKNYGIYVSNYYLNVLLKKT